MKVVAINGSPRPDGNTAHALHTVLSVLEREGIETSFIQLGGHTYAGCRACGACGRNKNMRCAIDDGMNEVIAQMADADGILIGSPTYFSNVTTEVKALIDRCGFVAGANGDFLRRKVGAPVVAVRRSGANFTYAAIQFFFGINEMIVPGSSYWNMTLARQPGDYEKDPEGVETMTTLGENMAWTLQRLFGESR
jgi:multimeric flavodoxin WrbA